MSPNQWEAFVYFHSLVEKNCIPAQQNFQACHLHQRNPSEKETRIYISSRWVWVPNPGVDFINHYATYAGLLCPMLNFYDTKKRLKSWA